MTCLHPSKVRPPKESGTTLDLLAVPGGVGGDPDPGRGKVQGLPQWCGGRAGTTMEDMNATHTQQPASGSAPGFGDQLKDMWATRPVRPAGDKKLGGVATAIGHRFDVDPVLIRVVFVVSALMGGAGLAVYLLCALLFKYQDDALRVHESMFHRKDEGRSLFLPIVLTILAVLVGPWAIGGSDIDMLSWVIVLALFVGLCGLYRHRPRPPAYMAWAYTRAPREDMHPASPAYMMTKVQMTQWERQGRPGRPADYGNTGATSAEDGDFSLYDGEGTPPSWDPLGAARFAWDLPEPPSTGVGGGAGPKDESARKGPRLTWIFASFAAVAGVAAFVLGRFFGFPSVTQALAIALVIVAAGMMIGAFRKRGLGLLPIAMLLGAAMTVTSFNGQYIGPTNFDPNAEDSFVGTTVNVAATDAQLAEGIQALGSSVILDLSDIGASDIDTEVNAIGSTIVFERPADHNLRINCDAAAMSDCETREYPATEPPAEGEAPTISVTANLLAATVEVQ